MLNRTPAPLFFLHINKTAGTTLYRFLESHYDCDTYIPDTMIDALRRAKEAGRSVFLEAISRYALITKLHINFSFLQDLRVINPSLRSLTVVREPVERSISQIEAWRRVPPEVLETVTNSASRALMLDARHMEIEAFVSKHAVRLSNFQSKMIGGLQKLEDQLSDDEILECATDALETIDYVGTTPGLPELCEALSWHMGYYNAFNPHRLNRTPELERLSDSEKRAITSTLAAMNGSDERLYRLAERRLFNLISDTRYALYRASTQHGSTLSAAASRETGFHVGMETALPGLGWHEREQGVKNLARWAGPGRFSSIYLPVRCKGTCRIRVYITSVISPELLSTLKLYLNDREVSHQLSSITDLVVLSATIPEQPKLSVGLKVVFEFAGAYSALTLHGIADDRNKTIAIERIDVDSVTQ